ncbi:hypothetical protein J3F84DRAFT_349732 [Trichoderma pleuroticola]
MAPFFSGPPDQETHDVGPETSISSSFSHMAPMWFRNMLQQLRTWADSFVMSNDAFATIGFMCMLHLAAISLNHSLDSAIATIVATPMRMHRQKLGLRQTSYAQHLRLDTLMPRNWAKCS